MPAVFQKTVEQDLHKPLKIQYCADTVFTKDNAGNQINVLLFEDGEPYNNGGTVSATAIRADGATESWAGTISGNTVSVALTRAALDVPGTLQVFIKVTAGTVETTVYAGVYNVVCTETPTVVAPVTPSDVAALIASIEAAIRNIPADWTSFLGTIAPTFEPDKADGYAAGAYVWYPGQPDNVGTLYRFTSAHSGTWTGTDATQVVIGNELNTLSNGLSNLGYQVSVNTTDIDVIQRTIGNGLDPNNTIKSQLDGIKADIGTVPTGETVEGQIGDLKSALNTQLDTLNDGVYTKKAITQTWTQGSINTSTGGNWSASGYPYSARCDYVNVGAADTLMFACDDGYRTNVYFYNGSTYISNSRVIIDSCARLVKIPSTATKWRRNFYKISDRDNNVDISETINEVVTHTAAYAVTPLVDSRSIEGITGIYGKYPAIVRDGNDYNVTITGYARSVWAGGSKTTATKTSATYTLSNANVLVYSPDEDAFSVVGMSAMGAHKNDIILLLNTHGALYGAWSLYYNMDNGDTPKTDNLPSYYNTYLDGKVADIESKSVLLGKRSNRFFWITDYHINGNQRYSPALISNIGKRTGINRTVFGGDAIQSFTTQTAGYTGLCDFCNDFAPVRELQDLYLITGNHEYNNPSANPDYASRQISGGAIYRLFFDQMPSKAVPLGDDENSFYFDDDTSRIRYYCLGATYNASITVTTRRLFGNSLLTVPDGYAVFVISHIAMSNGVLAERFEHIMEMCAALNDGTRVTINYTSSVSDTYDYTGHARTVIGALGGHVHHDDYYIYDGRFPVIVTTCDSNNYLPENWPDDTRVDGTVYEQAFDVVQIDLTTQRIYCTRIGAGDDRTFSFGDNATLIT